MITRRNFLLRLQAFIGPLIGSQPDTIGGQAVVEGVMMRSPGRLAVAVRAPDGSIALQDKSFQPFSRRHKLLGLPILRGAASLVEAVYIGTQALNWSISVQEPTPEKNADVQFNSPNSTRRTLAAGVTLLISFVFAMGLFQLLPYATSSWITGSTHLHPQNPLIFNGVAGIIRVSLLLAYMWGLSFLPDIKRVFQYHGAEHKSIFAYENKAPLAVSEIVKQSRFHPRCGTSFILIVAVICILFFSIFDALLLRTLGYSYPTFFHRFAIHLPFVPMVAGISFEVLKLSARFQDSSWIKPIVLPGLWLQKITTAEPDEKQIEVALASVNAALAK